MNKTVLIALLGLASLSFGETHSEVPYQPLSQDANWEKVAPVDIEAFTYYSVLVPGVSIGHRTRTENTGWDVNCSLWSILLVTFFKGNVSKLWYSEGSSPTYAGVGLFVGGGSLSIYRTTEFLGVDGGPIISIGKQWRTKGGGRMFCQLDGLIGIRTQFNVQPGLIIPSISIGTSF